MPLIALAYLAFLSGVLVDASGGGQGVALTLATIALACLWRGAKVPAALLLLSVAGIGLAYAERMDEERCRAHALTAGGWEVRLVGEASAGGSVRGLYVVGGCRLPVSVSVADGAAAAGSLTRVTGTVLPADGAVAARMVRAELYVTGAPGWVDRLRTRARERVRMLFGADDDALPAALLLADTGGLGTDLRQRFADAGLVHILAISGLHVGLVAAALELLLRALRMSRRVSGVAAAMGSLAYVALLGFPPAALRSGAMLATISLTRVMQRPTSSWAVLALGAIAPMLGHVRVVTTLGYQLSVVGVAALLAAGALARRWPPLARRRGWKADLGRSLLASTSASVATAPIIAWHFGRLSMIGPLANLVASPVVAFLQPLLFLAFALAPLQGAALLAADAARPVLTVLDWVATVSAAAPGATISVAPTFAGAVCAGVAVTAILVACVATFPARALIVGASAMVVAIWLPMMNGGPGELEVHLLDVGQGDAIAIRTPAGRWLLVDSGRGWMGGDAGRRKIVPYLRRRGGELEAFILSHPHLDHVGGAMSVLHALHPAWYWDPGYAVGGEAYRSSLAMAAAERVRWARVHPGDSLVVDRVVVSFLAPDSTWAASLPDANSASTVAMVRYGSIRILFTGDAEAPEEAWLLDRYGPEVLRADVLKVAHHGSRTSTTPAFLAAVRPRLALLSVGLANDYGHPDAGVMARLDESGVQVVRTDVMGDVVVRTDGNRLTVESGGESWSPDDLSRD